MSLMLNKELVRKTQGRYSIPQQCLLKEIYETGCDYLKVI